MGMSRENAATTEEDMQATHASRRGPLVLGVLSALGLALAGAPALADDPWPDIKRVVFDDRDILEEDSTITMDAPYRAEDAAIVPITVHIPASVAGDVKTLTLIIEKNPAPVAATFHFGPAAGKGDRMLSTRVRIDMYSNVRAVIETADSKLHMATKYVKASGGCSAPAGKDIDEVLANIGKMQIRTFDDAKGGGQSPATREAQVMIRHPNFTGMQMDQLTREYTPAKYVQDLEVKRGGELVFQMEGGVSISENPNLRFTFAPGIDPTLEVTAKDSDGRVFTATSAGKAT
jgi:sulfur-oxidizing protein SoxY